MSLSEAEAHWRAFLEGLVKRCLHGAWLIISDDHTGMEAVSKAVLTGVPSERCQFHLQQNVQAYIPRIGIWRKVPEDIRTIFNSPDIENAEIYLKKMMEKYLDFAQKLSDWMDINDLEGFTVFAFPKAHQGRLRTSNSLE